MQHSNRVLVLRLGAIHVVVIHLITMRKTRFFSGLLFVEMAFVNLTSIMFNRRARKVTASVRYFPPLRNATFGGFLTVGAQTLLAFAEKMEKKNKVAKPLVIPQHTYLAHSRSMYQIRNAQLSCVCGIISVN